MTSALLLALALASAPADTAGRAAAWSPPAGLARRVAGEVAERWGVEAASVRLEWPSASAAPVDSAAPFRLGGTGVGGYWSVVLPGRPLLRVRAGVERRVPVAARAVARGATLAAEDVAVAPVVEHGPPRAEGPAPGAGWTARRGIAAGEPLREPAVGPPLLVRAGQPAEVVWSGSGVQVRLRGVALGSASEGGRVAVRIDTARRLEGVAVAPGTVRVQP
ncbi:MAG TPA: flagellar basal body P-ring formation chaperone FlgA [Longimicrobiaceae bacterium]